MADFFVSVIESKFFASISKKIIGTRYVGGMSFLLPII